ncbi:septal ring factor EnvC (AmiA/AmiB activator) [Sphingomonas vulcanisoli]|uniref:Septal ring factor EnvC (AmiA/AmiB activator) n=1 Tax=Sphingomonas vulcanisoli TaxID=1658060 RepID=A0ABX0TU04_9SPHN|nr:hypothetical protein [Sphingomonas vulcanisoli]NIJ07255.1 septal ring factor EnvC (AmiA/AmiB activator) [Sphingomonas vulcanisoli]
MNKTIPPGRSTGLAPESVPPATQAMTLVQPQSSIGATEAILAIGGIAAAILAIAALAALIHRLMNRDVKRDIADVRRDTADVAQKLGTERGRIDALERFREDAGVRMVRLEANDVALRETLDRIDRNINDRFDEVVQSIREVRSVAPRR